MYYSLDLENNPLPNGLAINAYPKEKVDKLLVKIRRQVDLAVCHRATLYFLCVSSYIHRDPQCILFTLPRDIRTLIAHTIYNSISDDEEVMSPEPKRRARTEGRK